MLEKNRIFSMAGAAIAFLIYMILSQLLIYYEFSHPKLTSFTVVGLLILMIEIYRKKRKNR
ncbi:hypothetical protein MnBA_37680 [Marinobacterium sp. BA1]